MAQVTIELSDEMSEFIRDRLASGAYSTASEVVEDGLRSLTSEHDRIENWLKNEIGPVFDRIKDDPSRAVPIAEVRTRLEARRLQRREH